MTEDPKSSREPDHWMYADTGEVAADDVVERAWRDGWAQCKASLTEDEAFCLIDDVEQDAWLDSDTRAAMISASPDVSVIEREGRA